MRVFIGALWVLFLMTASRASGGSELRQVSRNSLVFIDSNKEGGEWAGYRVADELRPVIYRVEGPGRVMLKLRTFVQKGDRDGVGAILSDQRIVLTARVEPIADPDAKLVEGGKSPSKARIYLVRLGRGEHTVTVRYSEGPPILVAAQFMEGLDPEELRAAEDQDAEPPLVLPQSKTDAVQRIRSGEDDAATEDPPNDQEPESEAVLDADAETATTAAMEETSPARDRNDAAWKEGKKKLRPMDEAVSRTGPFDESKDSEMAANPMGSGVPDLSRAPRVERKLTVEAPYFLYEIRGGLMLSRLGLSPAPVVGMDARIPIPALDSRIFTMGLSIDASYARGEDTVLAEGSRVAIDVASIEHTSLEISADVRWVFRPVENVFDPYVALGLGALLGRLSTENNTQRLETTTTGFLGVVRVGGAFGKLGSRPFVELRFSGGTMFSDLTRSGPDDDAGYASISAVVGYRIELLTDAPAN